VPSHRPRPPTTTESERPGTRSPCTPWHKTVPAATSARHAIVCGSGAAASGGAVGVKASSQAPARRMANETTIVRVRDSCVRGMVASAT
jgi:hypothetical protein